MPANVQQGLRDRGFLRSTGPHAPDTVRRRLASWSTLTKWRGLTGAFASPALKSAIRLAVRAVPRPRKRKSAKAITGNVLAKLLATCGGGDLSDVRDRAILMVAFASGGRRRSEVASLRKEQLTIDAGNSRGRKPPPLALHPSWPDEEFRRQPRRGRLSDRAAGGGIERLADRRQDRQRQRVSGDRPLGQCVPPNA